LKAVNDKIIVRVDMAQKDAMTIGGVKFKMAPLFNKNYREKSPVIAEVVNGNQFLRSGQIVVFHHNMFYHPSPHFLYQDLYSIPFGKTAFGILDIEGGLTPLCGNILCNRLEVETTLPLPPEQRTLYKDRVLVTNPGWTRYKAGQLLFCTPSAMYEIVYTVDSKEFRTHKVYQEFIVGVE
jgi:hypothetical protein